MRFLGFGAERLCFLCNVAQTAGRARVTLEASSTQGCEMKSSASVVLAVGLMLGGHSAFAQDLSRYRDYVLGTSLDNAVWGDARLHC